LIIEGLFQWRWGSSGAPYQSPIPGGYNLGFMFLPTYRGFVVVAALVICLSTWYAIERTKLGAYLRAATENPTLVQSFGINVPRLITLTYGLGVGLAAMAGVLAAPIQQVSSLMGTNIVLVVFAVVVIGGMGSIMGSIVTGFGLGLVAGVLGAAALGLVTGALAIRRQGIYFAMITLAFAQMVYFLCVQMPFTGGEDGLQGIPRKPLLGFIPTENDYAMYYVVLAIFLFGYGAIDRFLHSPFGQVLK